MSFMIMIDMAPLNYWVIIIMHLSPLVRAFGIVPFTVGIKNNRFFQLYSYYGFKLNIYG